MILRATTLAGGKGPLLAGQDSLPSLPVPSLEQTLPKYLRTTLPHHQGNEASLKRTESAVEAALKGKDAALFKKLQERLQQRAKDPESDGNWLAAWWNDAAYMGYRDPVVPFVSYFYLHKDDRSRRTGPTRAASQIKAMLQFRKLLESEELAPEKTKSGPMCSGSYPWMFNSCRIPEKPIDQAKKYDPRSNNHLVVARNGHFFEFELVVNGEELSAAEIEAQLEKIVKDPAASKMDTLPVGALSSVDRDTWTDSRQALLNVTGDGGKHNQKMLERIESSVILLCLDDSAPVTTEERGWNVWWGDGKNRFYDKQQLIVTNNGKAGYMGEHSTMDGTPTLRMNDFILSALPAGKIDLGNSKRSDLPTPALLNFQLDKTVESRIASSIAAFEDLKSKHDLAVLEFSAYGKEAIKKFKCSPDAWVQMCIQVAFYKMFGKPAPTYESAQTRKFKWGRTETIRSCSPESQAFVEAFESGKVSDEEVYELFQKATKQHLSYAASAANGEGVDRHLFGLKKLLQEGEEVPDLYKDEMYAKSSHWLLSTSQISSESFDAWGYGEVVPDGFGCAYAIKSDYLTFSLTSRKQDAAKLRHYINEACLEMRDLHLRLASKSGGEKAKM
ncbi:putative carnitine O-acetyltransferase mitochondrial precursor [Acaromyces ingoldii]|uniref:Carnitine O-acetyltransferase, mitochondrial n=1 Tax=Acaromyces ingoldii TaxID=215250 RepID=A0A316YK68_9BASI|nr:putative carnitine O-acetyltransferase mitochondrial precursor [Acaromyces ingoldii]PWN89572.1 putative carnitine O-acetyltransferase mitochondrial precursor [Acaromyces ingoldii]